MPKARRNPGILGKPDTGMQNDAEKLEQRSYLVSQLTPEDVRVDFP